LLCKSTFALFTVFVGLVMRDIELPRFFALGTFADSNWCILSAPGGKDSTQFLSVMRLINSAKIGTWLSVFIDPKTMSFERARVTATLILRQSLMSSPIFNL
jgi:hypothetical protein